MTSQTDGPQDPAQDDSPLRAGLTVDGNDRGSSPISFFDYPWVAAEYSEQIMSAMQRVLRNGAFILQEDLSLFETELAEYVGASHVVGVANGTDALLISLQALDIPRGSEIILPAHTYVASAASIHYVGATPVLVDCCDDHLIDPAAVEAAITVRTAAIMPVHLNGRVCDMGQLCAIAKKFGLPIVEDAAQAVGAWYRGRHAGTFGAAGTFSFYPAKILGCFGDGGAVLAAEQDRADRIRRIRDHGRDKSGEIVEWGLNSRLDNLQAAILRVKLAHLAGTVRHRRELASRYHEQLSGVGEVLLPPPPVEVGEHFDSYQNYEIEAERRDDLRAYLAARGIGTLLPWGGRALHHCDGLGLAASVPRTDRLMKRVLLLPMNTALSTADVDVVAEAIRSFYGVS